MSLLTRLTSLLAPGRILPFAATGESLHALVYSDIYGGTADAYDVVTRETAMRVAPVVKGRAVIVGRLGDLPLELGTFDSSGQFIPDTEQPAWLAETDDIATTAWYRLAMSLDDVLFTGWCLWAVDRDEAGNITAADRVERNDWRFEQGPTPEHTGVSIRRGGVWVPVLDDRSVLLFPGPHEGLLTVAYDAIRGWRHMERAWVGRVQNPIPLLILKANGKKQVTQKEAENYVGAFTANRSKPGGAVGFLPDFLDAEALGEAKADLFNEGRNAARIDFANFLNLPVTYLDGSTATSSLTYVTQEGDRAQVIDDLEYWLAPFEAVLSERRVTGDTGTTRTKAIRANRSNLINVPNDIHGPERDTAPTATPAPEEAPA